MTWYHEWELVAPALQLLKENPEGLRTRDLREKLEEILKPSGCDMEILKDRKDTHFSQKVRNLKAHNTLTDPGYAVYVDEGEHHLRGVKFRITDRGIKRIEEIESVTEASKKQGFDLEEMGEKRKKNLSEMLIEEGQVTKRTVKQRRRSSQLKKAAKEKFQNTHEGRLFCEVCGFDFSETYGKLGERFIIVHHKEPIHSMDIEGEDANLEEAINKVALLCGNCHKMIHKKRGETMPVEKLKEIVTQSENKTSLRSKALREKRPLVFSGSGSLRLGKGFSAAELEASNIIPEYAESHGIYYDRKRESAHEFNVGILKKIKEKLS